MDSGEQVLAKLERSFYQDMAIYEEGEIESTSRVAHANRELLRRIAQALLREGTMSMEELYEDED